MEGVRQWRETVDFYCNGSESDVQKVSSMTCEDFHFWLERKVKAAKAQKAAVEKAKVKK